MKISYWSGDRIMQFVYLLALALIVLTVVVMGIMPMLASSVRDELTLDEKD